MKEVAINGTSTVAIVDDDDFDLVSSISWSLNNKGYVTGWHAGRAISLHDLVTPVAPRGFDKHHKNDNKLDNRKENIETLSRSRHHQLSKGATKASSGFRGVYYVGFPLKKPWVTRIKINGKTKHVGCFDTPEEAAEAYDNAAINHYGLGCYTNFKR